MQPPTLMAAANKEEVLEPMISKYVFSNVSISFSCCNCKISPCAISDETEESNFRTSREPSSTMISKHLLRR